MISLSMAGNALTMASAISGPDMLPDGRMNAPTPPFIKAWSSAGRFRIRSSFVRTYQPRLPASDSHSVSSAPSGKWSLRTSTLISTALRADGITLFPNPSSRKKVGDLCCSSVIFAPYRFLDFLRRAVIVLRQIHNGFSGGKPLVHNFRRNPSSRKNWTTKGNVGVNHNNLRRLVGFVPSCEKIELQCQS